MLNRFFIFSFNSPLLYFIQFNSGQVTESTDRRITAKYTNTLGLSFNHKRAETHLMIYWTRKVTFHLFEFIPLSCLDLNWSLPACLLSMQSKKVSTFCRSGKNFKCMNTQTSHSFGHSNMFIKIAKQFIKETSFQSQQGNIQLHFV